MSSFNRTGPNQKDGEGLAVRPSPRASRRYATTHPPPPAGASAATAQTQGGSCLPETRNPGLPGLTKRDARVERVPGRLTNPSNQRSRSK
jgi:hypothetical protein